MEVEELHHGGVGDYPGLPFVLLVAVGLVATVPVMAVAGVGPAAGGFLVGRDASAPRAGVKRLEDVVVSHLVQF